MDWPSADAAARSSIGFKGPAYTIRQGHRRARAWHIWRSPNSELYQRLVVKEQKADALSGGGPSDVDPSLFEIMARVKRAEDMDYVREQILATIKQFRETPVAPAKLDQVRKRLRYESALRMDNSDAIAGVLAHIHSTQTHARNHERPLRPGQAARKTFARPQSNTLPRKAGPSPPSPVRAGRRKVKRLSC